MGASLAPLRRVLTYMLLSTVYDKLSDERLVEEVAPIEGGAVPADETGVLRLSEQQQQGHPMCVPEG